MGYLLLSQYKHCPPIIQYLPQLMPSLNDLLPSKIPSTCPRKRLGPSSLQRTFLVAQPSLETAMSGASRSLEQLFRVIRTRLVKTPTHQEPLHEEQLSTTLKSKHMILRAMTPLPCSRDRVVTTKHQRLHCLLPTSCCSNAPTHKTELQI
ncbi:hypothetical protein GOBAR_DD07746 [Gossypium barbadense]|nr:hypothetical protein GOBAR_DD07746 [Gossypium barbadense]